MNCKLTLFLVSLLFCASQAWATCYIVQGGSGSISSNKAANSVIYSLAVNAPTSGTVSFSMTSNNRYSPTLQVQTSSNNGSSWTNQGSTIKFSNGTKNNQSVSIPESITNIRFVKVSSTTISYNYSVSNVNIEMATKMVQNGNSLSFTQKTAPGKTATVNYTGLKAYALDGKTVTGTCSNPLFTVTSTTIDDCTEELQIPIVFSPTAETAAGVQSGTVTLSCNNRTYTFSVSAEVTNATISHIAWTQALTSLLSVGNPEPLTLNATVADDAGNAIQGAQVVYSVPADNGVVSLSGNVLTILGNGETTITATYTSADEDQVTSCSTTRSVIVSDGSSCTTYVVQDMTEHSLGLYGTGAEYNLSAPCSSMSFNMRKYSNITTGEATVTFYNGSTALSSTDYAASSLTTSDVRKTLDIPSGATKVVFSGSGSLNKYVSNVEVMQSSYLTATTQSISATGENAANASVQFRYSNLPTAVSASLENSESASVSMQADVVGTGCGDWSNNATINLTFTPKTFGQRQYTYSGHVILSAGAGNGLTTVSVPVSVTIDMPNGDFNCGVALFYNTEAVRFDGNNTTAYRAEWSSDLTMLNFEAISGDLPATTPALLHNSTDAYYTYTKPLNPTLAAVGNNAFIYTTEARAAGNDERYFVLTASKTDPAVKPFFAKYTGTVPAGKIILRMPVAAGQEAPARFDIELDTNGTPTALRPVYAETDDRQDGPIYTIMGIPVSDMSQPGVYIRNGRKIVVH